LDQIVKKDEPPAFKTGSDDTLGSLKESQDRELRVRLSAEPLRA
jgi:hypothetical protein